MTLAILADIGGTNTRVALADGRDRCNPAASAAIPTPSIRRAGRISPISCATILPPPAHRSRRLRGGRRAGAGWRGQPDQSGLDDGRGQAARRHRCHARGHSERSASAGPRLGPYRGGQAAPGDRRPAAPRRRDAGGRSGHWRQRRPGAWHRGRADRAAVGMWPCQHAGAQSTKIWP